MGNILIATGVLALTICFMLLIAKVLAMSDDAEPCEHENQEYHAPGDIHDRSLPYTECLDCGEMIDKDEE